jgi:hypothetical protein
MRVDKETWLNFKNKYGEYEASRRLSYHTRRHLLFNMPKNKIARLLNYISELKHSGFIKESLCIIKNQRGILKMARTATRTAVKQPEAMARPTRPTRPTRPNKEPMLRGGWMSNPPEHCQNKVTDKDGEWCETIHCALCRDPECPAYAILKGGEKVRLKLMNSDQLPKVCPHCQCAIGEVSATLEVVTYICGTVGNRIEQKFDRKCK